MHLRNNIRVLRQRKKMTQLELADLLGVKSGTVSGYEKKVDGAPSFEVLVKLAEIFEISLDDLVFKDIEAEGYNVATQPVDADKEAMAKRLNEMLEHRVRELERHIREKDPEGAKELGIN